MNIGRKIAERRKALQLTQNELAERVGVSFQAVSSWEREEYVPDIEKLPRLARALGTSVAFLLEEQPAEEQAEKGRIIKEMPAERRSAKELPATGQTAGEQSAEKRMAEELPVKSMERRTGREQSMEEQETGTWRPKERMFSERNMYTFVRSAAVSRNLSQTMRALPLMKEYHAGQTRKGKEKIPYIIHPLMMACHCLALGLSDDDILATALLHDVCEDCHVTPDELPVTDSVKKSLDRLTFVVLDGETKEQAKARYFAAIPGDRVATIVKVIDRCNNISTMAVSFPRKKIVEYIEETEQYVMPLLVIMKNAYPECYNAAFLLKYQMRGILESLKGMLAMEQTAM